MNCKGEIILTASNESNFLHNKLYMSFLVKQLKSGHGFRGIKFQLNRNCANSTV